MQFVPWRGVFSIGSIIAIIGLVDVVPLTPHMVFGLFAATFLAILF